MPNNNGLIAALESMHEANVGLKSATALVYASREVLTGVLEELSGSMLPLQGIANMVAVRNGNTVYHVNRGSLLDSDKPQYFPPDYYKVGNIRRDVVILGHPESEDPNTGLIAVIGSLSIASESAIEESRLQRAVAEVS